ncbi:MAG: NIL domain-containing protein [Candidatus Omnitrophica bacterium]|nr:NIL domain-containing protein [Candidatus Omnitrophota bacterium]MCM8799441.1 NIL domain-containing protein [Candidatus Omnitrophota bacterium]
MAKQMVHLVFPQKLIKRPVIYTVAKRFNLIPNIRRANVTEKIGEVTLELSGKKQNIDRARKYLERIGVKFEPILGDIIE